MSSAYDQLLSVLRRYISQINAENILSRALRDLGLDRRQLTDAHFGDVAAKLEPSLRLFLRPTALTNVRGELRALRAPARPLEAVVLPIRAESDISAARAHARDISERLGVRRTTMQKIATVVSELARNIFMYTDGGTIEFHHTASPKAKLTVRAIDSGPGIPNLEDILEGRYRSRTGLGAGIRGTKRLCDRFDIKTGATGTRIEAEVEL